MLEAIQDELKSNHWITLGETELKKAKQSMYCALFRLQFHLSDLRADARCTIKISAVDRYRLYVNGQSVCSGPCKSDLNNRYYETLDLLPYLQEGENQLTVRVAVFPSRMDRNNCHGPYGVISLGFLPLLLCAGDFSQADKKTELSTGIAHWEGILEDGLEFVISRPYVIANPFEIHTHKNKNRLDFSAASWPQAKEHLFHQVPSYGEANPLMTKMRPIPLLYERERGFVRQMLGSTAGDLITAGSLTVSPHSHVSLVLDAGELTTAYVLLSTSGGDGSAVTFTYAEGYSMNEETKGRRDDWEHGIIIGSSDQFYPAGGKETFETFWFRSFRFLKIDITTGKQALELSLPRLTETAYPLEYKTQIASDQEWVQYIWDCSLRTLQLCMHETHEDCPTYEQLQYVMDTRLQMLFTYALSGDTRMARRVLWDFHCSVTPDGITQSRYPSQVRQMIPTFSLYFIFMLEEYLEQTGDLSLWQRYRTSVDGMLAYFDRHVNEAGLVEGLDDWDFCDWIAEWDDNKGVPHAVAHGPATVHNLIYVMGLQSAARMCELNGKNETAQEYNAKGNTILALLRQHCLDADGLLREGPAFAEYTQNAQILGVLTGFFTPEEGKEALLRCLDDQKIFKCTFPWMYLLFRALEKCGLYAYTAALWEPFKEMKAYALTTVPETPDFVHARSDCHAWGSLPLYEIPRCWLGVRPGSMGWESILIRPLPCGLDQLSGTVTTPKGDVRVAWQKQNGRFTLECETPENVPVKIILPDGRVTQGKGGKYRF